MIPTVNHTTVFFDGHVQGVGFRYTTLQVAKEFDVAGFVSNVADGRVRLEAEGAPAAVNAFIQAVGERMHGFVKNSERVVTARPPQFSGFEIR
jgi:acylphosphatase